MIQHWSVKYREGILPIHSSISGSQLTTEALAIEAFKKREPRANKIQVTKSGTSSETFDELRIWMEMNRITPEQAQGAIHCMVINTRPENQRPHICEKCKKDMNKVGINHIGNSYSCSACGFVFQVG